MAKQINSSLLLKKQKIIKRKIKKLEREIEEVTQ